MLLMTQGSGQASGQLSALLLSNLPGLVARTPEPCVSVHSHAFRGCRAPTAPHPRHFFPRQFVRGSGGEAGAAEYRD